jgi:hypothetical protein
MVMKDKKALLETGLKRIGRSPLLHFLVLGALLFGLFMLFFERRDETQRTITVTRGDVEQLVGRWQVQFKRPPTERELRSMIEDHIREEVFYREARSIELERDDVVIRRRLVQKLEFLSQDLLVPVDPTNEEMAAYLEANSERYRLPALLTFSHLFFSIDIRTFDESREEAIRVREELNGLTDIPPRAPERGDRFMLNLDYRNQSREDLVNLFGETEFVDALFQTETGSWQGPASSAYGLHLFYIQERNDARNPTLIEAREWVMEDMLRERRQQVNEAFYNELKGQYVIEFDDEVQALLGTGSDYQER